MKKVPAIARRPTFADPRLCVKKYFDLHCTGFGSFGFQLKYENLWRLRYSVSQFYQQKLKVRHEVGLTTYKTVTYRVSDKYHLLIT